MNGVKKLQPYILLVLICYQFSLLRFIAIEASETKPTIWIQIHRIEMADDIEGFLQGEPDWYYQISVWDGEGWKQYTRPTTIGDGLVEEENTHSFSLDEISSITMIFHITLLESDPGTDEVADISSHSGTVTSDQRLPAPRGAIYEGYYNLKTNSLSGDTTYFEEGYYKTSGDYDGSTATDENDANLWFDIWDNYDAPKAEAGTKKTCYTGDKVNFDGSDSSASSGSSIVKYEWDFDGDGIVDATGAKTSFTFNEKGKYKVTLIVTDSLGETNKDTCNVNVLARGPSASFTYSPEEPTIRDTIYFYDTSEDPDGTIVSWYWDFGDDSTSTIKNPTHKYQDKRSYTVTLTVRDDNDISDSITKMITMINLAPTADFTYSPSSPKVGADIQFTDRSTDPEGITLEYLWDFGDGFTSIQQNPKHKFTSSGMKYVRLTVTDDEDAEDFVIKSIKIIANVPPSADFSYSPENQKMNHDVQFNDESTDSDGYIVEWLWDFGDGITSTQENPTHQFKKGGEYLIRLKVTDDNGDSDDIIKKVNIIQTYDLTLKVKDIIGLAISNVEIGLYTDGECCASGSTDEKGILSLTEIAEGNYEIRAKGMGVTTSTTCSLTQSITEEIQVVLSFSTIGIMGGIIAVAAILGFYLTRRRKTIQTTKDKKIEEEIAPEEDTSIKLKKIELERERITNILNVFKWKFDKGEIDEETYLRLKKKYEKELQKLEEKK